MSDALYTAETLYFYAESFFDWPTAARNGHYYEVFSLEFEPCELNARLCELNRDSCELELLFR
jgi:hypothetical protein